MQCHIIFFVTQQSFQTGKETGKSQKRNPTVQKCLYSDEQNTAEYIKESLEKL